MEAYKISENEFTKRLQKFESIACQGNGYMCVRNSLEEDYVRSHRNSFINGVFNAPHGEVAELASLPDATNFEITADGERLDMPQIAFEMFGKCCEVDLGENTDNSDSGIHSASIGGIWLALAMGFGGVRAEEDDLIIEPILPEGITSYSLPIIYRGSKYQLNVDADGAKVERLDGEPQVVVLNGKTVKPK